MEFRPTDVRARLGKIAESITGQSDRRKTVTVVAVTAVVLMLAGSVAALTRSSTSNDHQLAGAAAQQPQSSQGSAAEPTNSDSTTSNVVGQTDDISSASPPRSSVDSSPSTSAVSAKAAPVVTTPSGKPVISVSPGTWANQAPNGLSLVITPSSPAVDPGTIVTFHAHVLDVTGGIKGLSWDFGDGVTSNSDVHSCEDPANAATVQNGQTNFSVDIGHAYRSPGAYIVKATAVTGSRCGAKASEETVTAIGSVVVNSGLVPSNGPAAPTVRLSTPNAMPEDPHVSIQVTSGDADGFISQVVIDWNDTGASPTVKTFPTTACQDSAKIWPSSSGTFSVDHDYVNAGTHSVTVTVTSTGCDGQSSQQAVGVAQVTSGGSSTTNPPVAQ